MALHPITWNDLDNLQVDEQTGRLYWKGKAVLLDQRITLRGLELILATIASIGALLAGIHPFGVTFGWW